MKPVITKKELLYGVIAILVLFILMCITGTSDYNETLEAEKQHKEMLRKYYEDADLD